MDSSSLFFQYSLLLAGPNTNLPTSVLIPKCYTLKRLSMDLNKTSPTKIDLQFVAFNKNRFVPLFYIDTLANLATRLGHQSPV